MFLPPGPLNYDVRCAPGIWIGGGISKAILVSQPFKAVAVVNSKVSFLAGSLIGRSAVVTEIISNRRGEV